MTLTTRVGFSTSKHPISAVIRWVTRSPASHAWLVYWDQDFQRDMVMEASAYGFRLIPFSVFQKNNTVIEVHDLGVMLHQGLSSVSDWLGSRYDGLGLIGMLWVYLGRMLKRRWSNPLGSPHGMFCTEAIVRALQADLFPGSSALVPEGSSPPDLMVFLRARL